MGAARTGKVGQRASARPAELMATYLLDTTFLIHLFENVPAALEWYGESREEHVLGTSSVNVAEIYTGAQPRHRTAWDSVFADALIWEVSARAGTWAGRIRHDLARQGIQVHLPDALIAGVAIDHRASIVTANVKDFAAMGLEVVRVDRK